MFLSEVSADAITALTPAQLQQVLDLAEVGFGRRTAAQLVGIHVRQIPVPLFAVARRRGRFFREASRDASRDRPHPHPDQWPPGETNPRGVIYSHEIP